MFIKVPPHIIFEPWASSLMMFIILFLNSLSTIIFSNALSVICTEIFDPHDIESISFQISFLKFSNFSDSDSPCVWLAPVAPDVILFVKSFVWTDKLYPNIESTPMQLPPFFRFIYIFQITIELSLTPSKALVSNNCHIFLKMEPQITM